MSIRFAVPLVLGFFALTAQASHKDAGNSVAKFLEGSERQMESSSQCHELKQALQDILREDPHTLKGRRYPNYQGVQGQWDVTRVLKSYIVPEYPHTLDEDRFFKDVKGTRAQHAVLGQLHRLDCRKYN